MKNKKNILTLTLIFSSVLMLLALQTFWLQKVYRDEEETFKRQTHIHFRNALFEMNDSLLIKSIKPFSGGGVRFYGSSSVDTISWNKKSIKVKDSTANVQVFISTNSKNDSIEKVLKPLVNRIRLDRGERRFTIQLTNDTIPLTDIEKKFKTTLAGLGIDLPFKVKREASGLPFNPRRITFENDVIMTPSGSYRLEFVDLPAYLIRKISAPILFSIFLTVLTISSFYFLYRNIRSQQKLMELKNDFISNVAHELKTPVTTVGVALEALKNFKGLDNPKLTEEYLDIAQKELSRLTLLTDKILKTAIFENKGVHFQPEPVQLDQLIEQVLSSMKLVFDKQGAKLHWQKTGDNFQVIGGSVHLMSVIYNLLDNALKYSPTHPDIKVELKREPDALILVVQDNGVGISSEYQKKIFEKFFRVPTGDVHNIKGYGLGLSYVQSVMKAHAGKIEVESKVGEGSKFILTFPSATA